MSGTSRGPAHPLGVRATHHQEGPRDAPSHRNRRRLIRRRARCRRPSPTSRPPSGSRPDRMSRTSTSRGNRRQPDRRHSSSSTSPSGSVSTGASPRSSRSTTSRSAWSAARSTGSSGPTAPASRPSSASSRGLLTLDRGTGRGLRLRHRARRARREAAHQPGVASMRRSSRSSARWRTSCSPPASTASMPARRSDEATAILGRLGIAENRLGRPGGADEPGDAAEGRDRASPADEPDAAAAGRADHRPRPAQQARRPGVHRGGQRRARRDDRPHDARPGRGGAPLRADHDPRRGSRSSPRTRPRGSSDSSPSSHGQPPTLEAVFMTYTGRSLDEDVEEDEPTTTDTNERRCRDDRQHSAPGRTAITSPLERTIDVCTSSSGSRTINERQALERSFRAADRAALGQARSIRSPGGRVARPTRPPGGR